MRSIVYKTEYACERECKCRFRGYCEWLWLCDITCFGCFLLSRDFLLAVDSCVLLVAAAGWDDDAVALEEHC